MAGQNTQVSLSGTYGVIGIHHQEDFRPDRQFDAIGAALGIELTFGKRITIGGDVDWQGLESEPSVAEPLLLSGLSPVIYSVERHQLNLRPTIRYYFKEAFQGFFVGLFGTYSYLTIKTSGYPESNQYHHDYPADPSDDFGLGGGLTYGYRLKLNSALRVSAFGSHQLFWNDMPKFRQQDHQIGLGLNWAF